jgi:hypothetical protein
MSLFNVYGYRIRLSGDAQDAKKNVTSDFQHFLCNDGDPAPSVELLDCDPPYDSAPAGVASVYTPRNVAYTVGNKSFIDYGGRGLAVYDRGAGGLTIYSRDQDLLYEACYLFLLSRIAEYLDKRRMHRVHALALAYNGKAVLVLLPMGGGKSTLGSALLRFPELDFLSDDSPFVSGDGVVHAFPLRLGLLPGNEDGIPAQYLRRIERMEFGPKMVVSSEYYANRIKDSAAPGLVFLGRRSLSRECRIEPAGTLDGLKSMLANCVVGLGLFQGMEFVFRHNLLEIVAKTGAGFSRLRVSRRLLARSEVYHLTLGRDYQRNADTVREFVHRRLC